MGQNETTRNWTAGCSPSVYKSKPFWIPMFDSLTHRQLFESESKPGQDEFGRDSDSPSHKNGCLRRLLISLDSG